MLSGSNGLSNGPVSNVVTLQNRVFALKNDSVFVLIGSVWSFCYGDSWTIINMNVSSNKILLSERSTTGQTRIVVLNSDCTVPVTLTQPPGISYPRKTIIVNNDYWVADSINGLTHLSSNSALVEQYKLNSPESIALGEIKFADNVFYATSGEVTHSGLPQNNKNGIYLFKEENWININRKTYPQLDSVPDLVTIAIDAADKTIWAGSFGGGLLHVKADNSIEIFKQTSPIRPAVNNPGSYRVSGLAFDKEKIFGYLTMEAISHYW